jgi:transposase
MKTPLEKHEACLAYLNGSTSMREFADRAGVYTGTFSKWYTRWRDHGKSPAAFMVKRGRPSKGHPTAKEGA